MQIDKIIVKKLMWRSFQVMVTLWCTFDFTYDIHYTRNEMVFKSGVNIIFLCTTLAKYVRVVSVPEVAAATLECMRKTAVYGYGYGVPI